MTVDAGDTVYDAARASQLPGIVNATDVLRALRAGKSLVPNTEHVELEYVDLRKPR